MQKWTKTAGLLFIAAASVYTSQAIVAATGSGANPTTVATLQSPATPVVASRVASSPDVLMGAPGDNTDVKLIEEAPATTAPSTASSADATSTDPFASSATTAPSDATADAGADSAAPTSQPSGGQSVSNSEVSVSDAGTVEIHVNDANLVEVLRMLSLQSQKNIIASKDVHGTVTANLYDVTVREALDAILHANGYGYREKGNFIYVYTSKEIADMEKADRHMNTEVFHVYYTPAVNAATMIKPVLSTTGQVAVSAAAKVGISSAPGGGGGNDVASDDTLVVTDYPENLDQVRKVLADIDKRPQQILLEATILRAQLNEDNALGVDFNILGGVDLNSLTFNNGQLTNADVVAGTGGTIATNGRVSTVGTGNSFTSPIKGGLKVGYLTNSVSIFLSALEQTTDTTILANPKILALNKQQGEVFVGNEDGYYTTLTTETTTSQSVQSLQTGTKLIFRPFIGDDGYIRMEVHPEDSDGSVKANGLPSKNTTEVTSNIMVKDGHTIVIGGLFRDSTISTRNQVPFLGNIPIAGALFRNQNDTTVREEVIILLTPHIVKDDASYSKLSEDELKHAEDLRVGARKGLMPWGRERLAEGWYESAKREMAKPHPDRKLAKWDLDAATNLYPGFSEAIELKEQITGHEVTDADGSSIRSFVRRAIMTDVVPATQPTTTALDDGSAAPATQPTADDTSGEDMTADAPATTQPADSSDQTAGAATTQPDATASTDESATSGQNGEAMSEQPENPSQAQPGTEEATVSDESAAVPAPATQPTEQPLNPWDQPGAAALNDGEATPAQPENAPQPSDQSATATPQSPDAAPATQPAAEDGATAQTDQSPVVDQPAGINDAPSGDTEAPAGNTPDQSGQQ